MKFYGIGSDIIRNNRIKNSIKNKKFLERVFTKEEIKIGLKKRNNHTFYAKRFAAKEAFVKALGTGFRDNINFNSISILNDKNGKPFITYDKIMKKKVQSIIKKKTFNIFCLYQMKKIIR